MIEPSNAAAEPPGATAVEPRLALERGADGRARVRWFVSYAHANRDEVTDFLRRLEPRLAISKTYAFEGWKDGQILVGEDWRHQISAALRDADLGLLLVTPEFLNSAFITTEELPAFLGPDGRGVAGKLAVPVALWPIDLSYMNLCGLEARQIYRGEGGAFVEQTGYRRDVWVDGLVRQLHAVLARYATEARA